MIIQHDNFGNDSNLRFGMHENHSYGDHIHQFSELVIVYDGEIEITTEGHREIGKKGDVYIITPFQVHSFYTPVYSKIWICVFSNDFALNIVSEEDLYRGWDNALFTLSPELFAYVNSRIIESAAAFKWKNDENGYRTVKACINALFAEYLSKVSPTSSRKNKDALSAIFLYITKHYTEKITLSTVSCAIGYSAGHISHCLEAIPGFNFNSLVNSLRVEHAKSLLRTTSMKSVDIAFESGFPCERSFHRAFKQLTQMTPKEYVKKSKVKLANSI